MCSAIFRDTLVTCKVIMTTSRGYSYKYLHRSSYDGEKIANKDFQFWHLPKNYYKSGMRHSLEKSRIQPHNHTKSSLYEKKNPVEKMFLFLFTIA